MNQCLWRWINIRPWLCLYAGCKELDSLLRFKTSQSMNYESFVKLLWVDLQLRRKGWSELCHRSRPESAWCLIVPVQFVDSFLICFVSLLLWIAEQIAVMLLWGDVAALDESFYPSSATVFPSVPWRTDRMPQTSNKYSKWRRKRTAEPPETAGSNIPKNWSDTVVTLEPLRAWLRPHSSIRISVTLDWPQTQYCFDCAFNYKLKLPPPFRTTKNKTKVSIKFDFQLRLLNVFS